MSYNGGRRIYVDADGYEHMDIDHDEPTNRITNADKIRAMTDEDLASFIAYDTSCETCVVRKSGSDECHETNCSTAWLDWLKQEAKE